MRSLHDQIVAAKARLSLPALLAQLDLSAHARKSAKCPLHQDRSPSFSIWQGPHGWRWKCHSSCGEGDEIDFLERLRGTTRADAVRQFIEMAGGSLTPLPVAPVAPSRGLVLPDDATPGSEADWRELAERRGFSWHAPGKAAELGTLIFGTVCGFRSWILTDEKRLCAEARRMDGKPFPAVGNLGERKAHTLKSSVKSWPVGLAVRGFTPADFRAVLVTEGSPDYLAALHFTLADKSDCLPIAFLGAGSASAIHPDALALLRGARLRFYPHADTAGAAAVDKWADQLRGAGVTFDAFNFAGLRKADGSPVKDLNDSALIHPDDTRELEGLLP